MPFLFWLGTVALVGGSQVGAGNVFARNPKTGIYGPVCDDQWDMLDVHFCYLNSKT